MYKLTVPCFCCDLCGPGDSPLFGVVMSSCSMHLKPDEVVGCFRKYGVTLVGSGHENLDACPTGTILGKVHLLTQEPNWQRVKMSNVWCVRAWQSVGAQMLGRKVWDTFRNKGRVRMVVLSWLFVCFFFLICQILQTIATK